MSSIPKFQASFVAVKPEQFIVSDLVGNPEDRIYHEEIHYDNTPMQYTAIFDGCTHGNFQMKNVIFLVYAQDRDHGYTLKILSSSHEIF